MPSIGRHLLEAHVLPIPDKFFVSGSGLRYIYSERGDKRRPSHLRSWVEQQCHTSSASMIFAVLVLLVAGESVITYTQHIYTTVGYIGTQVISHYEVFNNNQSQIVGYCTMRVNVENLFDIRNICFVNLPKTSNCSLCYIAVQWDDVAKCGFMSYFSTNIRQKWTVQVSVYSYNTFRVHVYKKDP